MDTFSDYRRIAVEQPPLIDVRAPAEFQKGAFVNSVNLPLMDDEERHQVGICYAEKGSEEAVALGHRLVSGEIRKDRIDAWFTYIKKHPNSILYCFRGGMRSQISQRWIFEETGIQVPRLEGGYKAFRNYLIGSLEPDQFQSTPLVVSGLTGSGKTQVIHMLNNAIDLEQIANHRGSAFGRHLSPQPTQIRFENDLSYAIIRHQNNGYRFMVFEDEGNYVGRCFIPHPVFQYFHEADVVFIDSPLADRIETTFMEYVVQAQENYRVEYGTDQGFSEWKDYILSGMKKLKKRLGGERFGKLLCSFESACHNQEESGKPPTRHKDWISFLLKEYYDPLYSYPMQQHKNRILFQGDKSAVFNYLKGKEEKWDGS